MTTTDPTVPAWDRANKLTVRALIDALDGLPPDAYVLMWTPTAPGPSGHLLAFVKHDAGPRHPTHGTPPPVWLCSPATLEFPL